MSTNVRKTFIDGLISLKDETYYPFAKYEILQLKDKKLAQNYINLPWVKRTKIADRDNLISKRLDIQTTKLLYSHVKPCSFYVDWQSDRNYGVVIPDSERNDFARYRLRKKLIDNNLETDHAYRAVVVVDKDDNTKIKFMGNVTKEDNPEFIQLYLKEKQGVFRAKRDFGFIVNKEFAETEDYFCNPQVVVENNLHNHDKIHFLAKFTFNKKKEQWRWQVKQIESVKKVAPSTYQRKFCGSIIIKENRHGHLFGFVEDKGVSCYVSDKLLNEIGISENNYCRENYNITVLAEKNYNRQHHAWKWTANKIDRYNKV